MRPKGNEGIMSKSMTRRDRLIGAGLWMPVIVRIGSLMPVKRKVFVRPPARIDLADRRRIAAHVPRILMLREASLSAWAIAAVWNDREEERDAVRMVAPWIAGHVLHTIRESRTVAGNRFLKGDDDW
jgi:hypothetical protein